MECSQCSSVAMKFPLEEKMSGSSCLCAGLAAAELGVEASPCLALEVAYSQFSWRSL